MTKNSPDEQTTKVRENSLRMQAVPSHCPCRTLTQEPKPFTHCIYRIYEITTRMTNQQPHIQARKDPDHQQRAHTKSLLLYSLTKIWS